jgi:hypothetical protein
MDVALGLPDVWDLNRLGHGSFGSTWRGKALSADELNEIQVVVKKSVWWHGQEEAAVLRKLAEGNAHPSIVRLYGETELRGQHFLILDDCGLDLTRVRCREGLGATVVLGVFSRSLLRGRLQR